MEKRINYNTTEQAQRECQQGGKGDGHIPEQHVQKKMRPIGHELPFM